jgi:NAD(P)-dependent dehydrogenase (short-subunit alcohol dehydrogenase family)
VVENDRSRVVVVTGASSGLGAGLCKRFVRHGFRVAALARRKSMLDQLERDSEGQILGFVCDVKSRESVLACIDAVHNKMGAIDIFVANAGISEPTPGDNFDGKRFENVILTNVMGAVYGFEAVIPHMLGRKEGQLVSIGSLASYRGLPQSGAYSSSKAALSALTESLRIDLKPYGIAVSLINPGFIKTPLTDRNLYKMPFLLGTEDGVEKIFDAILKKKSIYAFPKPMAVLAQSFRWWPVWFYDFVMGRIKNQKIASGDI